MTNRRLYLAFAAGSALPGGAFGEGNSTVAGKIDAILTDTIQLRLRNDMKVSTKVVSELRVVWLTVAQPGEIKEVATPAPQPASIMRDG